MTYHYIFCEICGQICDIVQNYDEGFEYYICEDHGEVKGVPSKSCLCIGCKNFDRELIPHFKYYRIDGFCVVYPTFPFKLFRRKSKCKYFMRI